MIVGIEGNIVKKEPTFLHIKLSNGFTYRVHVSLFTSAKVDGEFVSLFTTQIIREDHHALYGFYDMDEKNIFDTVIKLNGIGPSTALAVCSTLTPNEFSMALVNQSIESFKRVPGIGPKSAKRILVELSDFSLESLHSGSENSAVNEASQALESLGFKKDRINKILTACKSDNTTALIKEALKKLG
ncbi:MAG: Holliday junction branch migration protein RuvA [Epsilonproteobacteria bacterium]|nr:Holliday junction branch migration protein RuvA [Campylobacterota bacterium]